MEVPDSVFNSFSPYQIQEEQLSRRMTLPAILHVHLVNETQSAHWRDFVSLHCALNRWLGILGFLMVKQPVITPISIYGCPD